MDNLVGRSFGPYEIRKLLGSGGMGMVYLAHEMKLDRHVAVKILSPQLALDAAFVERFSREARALAALSHRNLIHVYAIDRTEDGYHYMAMEYLDGRTLDARILETGGLAVPEALGIMGQVLSALSAIHRAGLVHRDIKPANIMLNKDGRAILMDFGLAKSNDQPGVTREGIIAGTPEYMSPEQARGEELDNRSDLYSLGVVFFEMLTAKVPFEGPSAITILRQHCEDEPPDVMKLRPGLPREVAHVLDVMLAKQASARFGDACDMAAALLALGRTSELEDLAKRSRKSALPATRMVQTDHSIPRKTVAGRRTAPKVPTQPSERKPESRWWRYAIIGLVALVALFFVGKALKNSGKTVSPPVMVTDPSGKVFEANPWCQFDTAGGVPKIGRIVSVENGVVTYIPLDSTAPAVLKDVTGIIVLDPGQKRKLNIPN
ncbi:MAG: serine/threonine-protein kinase [Candidatus Brocadiia bacterium]